MLIENRAVLQYMEHCNENGKVAAVFLSTISSPGYAITTKSLKKTSKFAAFLYFNPHGSEQHISFIGDPLAAEREAVANVLNKFGAFLISVTELTNKARQFVARESEPFRYTWFIAIGDRVLVNYPGSPFHNMIVEVTGKNLYDVAVRLPGDDFIGTVPYTNVAKVSGELE